MSRSKSPAVDRLKESRRLLEEAGFTIAGHQAVADRENGDGRMNVAFRFFDVGKAGLVIRLLVHSFVDGRTMRVSYAYSLKIASREALDELGAGVWSFAPVMCEDRMENPAKMMQDVRLRAAMAMKAIGVSCDGLSSFASEARSYFMGLDAGRTEESDVREG